MPPKTKKPKTKISTKFAGTLAIISIIGFLEIILQSFFSFSIQDLSSFFWLMIMGIGFIIITNPKNLYKSSKKSFNEASFSMLTTFVVGFLAIIAGILSLPFFDINHPILPATMGVISIISVIFIIFQTWIIKN